MNANITTNYAKLKPSLLYLPLILLIAIALFFYGQNALNVDSYIQIQKDSFFFLNSKLGQFPQTEYNLTQIGDALIFFSFLSIFIIYASKMWESLISASLVSLIFAAVLKRIFSVPRPAAVFDNSCFEIIGKTYSGHTSLPSGHSMTVFATLTVLMFAFMPIKLKFKILWCLFIVVVGLILASTRVGVGAHYPLDVVIGSIIGYISGILGIFISRKYNLWAWISIKKYYPVFMLLFAACVFSLIAKIIDFNLIVFYLSLTTITISLYKIVHVYFKKQI